MKIIKATYDHEIPKNFTGIIEYEGGEKYWYKNGKLHREDGHAVEYSNGVSYFYFVKISLF